MHALPNLGWPMHAFSRLKWALFLLLEIKHVTHLLTTVLTNKVEAMLSTLTRTIRNQK